MTDQIVATYDYTDEIGNLLYQVVRYFPKTFRARRFVNGAWVAGKGEQGSTLYHLPMLVDAVRGKGTVFMLEGEKDVDNLITAMFGKASPFAVTTVAFGANNWKSEFKRYFAGASQVVILPDNDKPGHEYAMTVARSLAGTVQDIRIVELPDLAEKEDVSDWLDKGNPIWSLWLEVYKTPPLMLPDEPDVPMIMHSLKQTPVKIESRDTNGSREKIENINRRGVEILSQYVSLERAGHNRFRFICPFHKETQPSAVLYEDQGSYWCYGCGTGGDIIDFVQRKTGMSFKEVIGSLI